MAAPVLFLEPDSGHMHKVEIAEATSTAINLIRTLHSIKKYNRIISFNSPTPLSDCQPAPGLTLQAILGGTNYRDEWSFLRDLATKSPISSGLGQLIDAADLLESKTAAGQKSTALTWANLLETGTISFYAKEEWKESWINAHCTKIDSESNIFEENTQIPNVSNCTHADEHQLWIEQLGYSKNPSANDFWATRESRYEGIRFLKRVKNQISDLSITGSPYTQALETLNSLNKDSLAWAENGGVKFSIKVADGEHDNRRHLTKFNDEKSGDDFFFQKHAYFTGGIPGRIHFRICAEEKKIIVAHIGQKL